MTRRILVKWNTLTCPARPRLPVRNIQNNYVYLCITSPFHSITLTYLVMYYVLFWDNNWINSCQLDIHALLCGQILSLQCVHGIRFSMLQALATADTYEAWKEKTNLEDLSLRWRLQAWKKGVNLLSLQRCWADWSEHSFPQLKDGVRTLRSFWWNSHLNNLYSQLWMSWNVCLFVSFRFNRVSLFQLRITVSMRVSIPEAIRSTNQPCTREKSIIDSFAVNSIPVTVTGFPAETLVCQCNTRAALAHTWPSLGTNFEPVFVCMHTLTHLRAQMEQNTEHHTTFSCRLLHSFDQLSVHL